MPHFPLLLVGIIFDVKNPIYLEQYFWLAGNKILEEHQQLILTQDKATGNQQYLKIVNSENIYIDQQGVHKIVENVRIVDENDQNIPIQSVHAVDDESHHHIRLNDSKIEIIERDDDDDEKVDSDRESLRQVKTFFP